jgi:hypothetical protein
MNSSLLERPAVCGEEVASFGGALLLKHPEGRLEIVGGTEGERMRAQEWAARHLYNGAEVRWECSAVRGNMAG